MYVIITIMGFVFFFVALKKEPKVLFGSAAMVLFFTAAMASANIEKNYCEYENVTSVDIYNNMIHGEMWNYSANSTAWTFPIAASGKYYNLTGLALGELNDFTFTDAAQVSGGSYLTADKAGTYKMDFSMSFGSTGKGLYGIAVVHDFDVDTHRDCYARRQVSATGDVGNIGITCIMDIDVGDEINVQIEDEDNPVKDIKIHTVNINMIRIGD